MASGHHVEFLSVMSPGDFVAQLSQIRKCDMACRTALPEFIYSGSKSCGLFSVSLLEALQQMVYRQKISDIDRLKCIIVGLS